VLGGGATRPQPGRGRVCPGPGPANDLGGHWQPRGPRSSRWWTRARHKRTRRAEGRPGAGCRGSARTERASHTVVPGAAGLRERRQRRQRRHQRERGDAEPEAARSSPKQPKGARNRGRLGGLTYITGIQIGCRNWSGPVGRFWPRCWEKSPSVCATPIGIHPFPVGVAPLFAHPPSGVFGWVLVTPMRLPLAPPGGAIRCVPPDGQIVTFAFYPLALAPLALDPLRLCVSAPLRLSVSASLVLCVSASLRLSVSASLVLWPSAPLRLCALGACPSGPLALCPSALRRYDRPRSSLRRFPAPPRLAVALPRLGECLPFPGACPPGLRVCCPTPEVIFHSLGSARTVDFGLELTQFPQ